MATTRSTKAKPTAKTTTPRNGAARNTTTKTAAADPHKTTTGKAAANRAEAESVVEPVEALQQLAIENAGKLAELQLVAWRRYSEAVFDGCREMATIEDAEAFQAFVARQPDTVRSLTTAAAEDFQAATRIGMDYMRAAGDILGRAFNQPA